MTCRLIIYGAAYGRNDVTKKIKSFLSRGQKLTVKATNDVFGDSWEGQKKTLVVVYKYDNGPSDEVRQAIIKEGDTLELSPKTAVREEGSNFSRTTRGAVLHREQHLKLDILGAAYGLANVTSHAQSLVTANQEFNQMATNKVWTDGWPGEKKTLVVVYTYSDIHMIDIVVEGKRMHCIASPPLRILGAAYGLKCVTEKVQQLVKNRCFSAKADNNTFGKGWSGEEKTLVVVYRYGDEEPAVTTAKENMWLEFMYSKRPEFSGSTDHGNLTILGAAYGPQDVTYRVRDLVKDCRTLDVEASNHVFGDSWCGQKKSLVIVYRYANNKPEIQMIKEKTSIHLH